MSASRCPASDRPPSTWPVSATLAAAVALPAAGLGGVREVIVLDAIRGLGYGWLLPRLPRGSIVPARAAA